MKDGRWQLQEAKKRFSQVVERARRFGPQIVTKYGKDAVVVLSFEDYQKMVRPRNSLVEFLRKSPLFHSDIDFSKLRRKDKPRDVEL